MAQPSATSRFQAGTLVSKPELTATLRLAYPAAKPTTINWHIHQLLQQGMLTRLGRGQYRVGGDARQPHDQFRPVLPDELVRLASQVQAQFPYLDTCFWSTQAVLPYLMHVPFVQYGLLEVDRDGVDTVLRFVQSFFGTTDNQSSVPVIRASDLPMMDAYIADAPQVILVKPLISEAPRQRINMVPTITAEKLIVDLIADERVFFMYQEELPRIVQGISARYVINMDKIRRYARRRNQLRQLNELLTQANVPLVV